MCTVKLLDTGRKELVFIKFSFDIVLYISNQVPISDMLVFGARLLAGKKISSDIFIYTLNEAVSSQMEVHLRKCTLH